MDLILDGTQVKAFGSHHRGFTPEEIAEHTIDKIMFIGKDSHPAIRDQAITFKNLIHAELVSALKQAVQSDRLTLTHRFTEAGHPELTKLLEN